MNPPHDKNLIELTAEQKEAIHECLEANLPEHHGYALLYSPFFDSPLGNRPHVPVAMLSNVVPPSVRDMMKTIAAEIDEQYGRKTNYPNTSS